jgi:hypothetical protein
MVDSRYSLSSFEDTIPSEPENDMRDKLANSTLKVSKGIFRLTDKSQETTAQEEVDDHAKPWIPPTPTPCDVAVSKSAAQTPRETLNSWLRNIDLSQMRFVDRMIFDINRRAIIERNVQDSQARSTQSSLKGTGQVFNRLIEDINRRNVVKDKLEELGKIEKYEKETQYLTPNRSISRERTEAVINRLTSDALRRKETQGIREKFKELKEVEAVKSAQPSFRHTPQSESKLVTRLLDDAGKRNAQREYFSREKEILTQKLAKAMANARHPRRQLDDSVMRRLTQEDPTPSIHRSHSSSTQPNARSQKLFSLRDGLASGARLMKARGINKPTVQPEEISKPKLSGKDIDNLVKRLYNAPGAGKMRSLSAGRTRFNTAQLSEYLRKSSASPEVRDLLSRLKEEQDTSISFLE